jgi:ferredoxin
MPSLKIDGRDVEVGAGATVLDAARRLGIEIPALCHREGCTPNTSCLACVVRVKGVRRLMPSCATPATDGMEVESETAEVRDARRTAIELLLADHAGDCRAPCQNVCPAHMDIPKMIRLIGAGAYRDALVTVKETIALPAILGRICPELCEKGCRRAAVDDAVSICRLKRFVADADLASGAPYRPGVLPATGKRVAVVGSGPAGMAAAYYLQVFGHQCTVYDANDRAGGPLRYAIDKSILPDEVIDAEFDVIWGLGVRFVPGMKLGRDVSVDELRASHDAVLLAIGEVDPAAAAGLGVAVAGRVIRADRQTMMTSMSGVFAAGGAVAPSKHAVKAVAEGKAAAVVISAYLNGLTVARPAPEFTVRLGKLNDAEQAIYADGADPAARAAAPGGGAGFPGTIAEGEANRCLQCQCAKQETCALRHWSQHTGANVKAFAMERRPVERVGTHPDLVYEPGKCISCGLCVQIARRAGEPLGLTFVGRGFSMRIGVPFDGALADALRVAARECAAACPTAALTLRNAQS